MLCGVCFFSVMGRHFGKLTRVRNIITYSLSPFEQRAFAGAISKGVPNMVRRFAGQVFRVVPRKSSVLIIFVCSIFLELEMGSFWLSWNSDVFRVPSIHLEICLNLQAKFMSVGSPCMESFTSPVQIMMVYYSVSVWLRVGLFGSYVLVLMSSQPVWLSQGKTVW